MVLRVPREEDEMGALQGIHGKLKGDVIARCVSKQCLHRHGILPRLRRFEQEYEASRGRVPWTGTRHAVTLDTRCLARHMARLNNLHTRHARAPSGRCDRTINFGIVPEKIATLLWNGSFTEDCRHAMHDMKHWLHTFHHQLHPSHRFLCVFAAFQRQLFAILSNNKFARLACIFTPFTLLKPLQVGPRPSTLSTTRFEKFRLKVDMAQARLPTTLVHVRSERGRGNTRSKLRVCCAHASTHEVEKVLVVGASRGAGLAVAKHLSQSDRFVALAGIQVDSNDDELTKTGVEIVARGDARNEEFVAKLLGKARPDAIVSCIGGKVGDCRRADYTGNRCLIDAALNLGVKKFILVSSIGAGDSEAAIPGPSKDAVMPLMMDKTRAEIYLKESGIPQYFILRAGPLFHGNGDESLLSECPTAYGELSYIGLSKVVHTCLSEERMWSKTYSAIDRDRVYVSNPFVRPLESFEPIPFPTVEM